MDSLICLLILFAIICLVIKAYRINHYFEKWGVPQAREIPFLGFMCSNFFPRRHLNAVVKEMYNLDSKAKYIGCHTFLTPSIMVRDLDLIKTVLVKDFDYFAYRKDFIDETLDPLFGLNLAFLNGDKWRKVRNLLSPAFTSSKMRSMYVLMSKCAANFTKQFLEIYENADAIDIKDVFNRYSNDVIATCAFGIEVDSLKNPKNEFYIHGKAAAAFQGLRQYKMMLVRALPTLTQALGMRIISQKETDFFVDLIQSTMKARKERGIRRPDMLQLMIDACENIHLDIVEVTAQAFLFFLAGFETTAMQMCIITQELVGNPDIQQKLQAEIDTVIEESNGELTYEIVNNMVYLDAVFMESLRMHPMGFLHRMCSKEYELPPTLPDAKPYIVKAGTEIFVASAGIHSDPNYYENPERFDPERFLNKKAAISDVTSLGFGLGPRMCIGNRFAILETKVLLVHLLAKCNLVACEKTCLPFVYDPNIIVPFPKSGFWLRIVRRD